MVSRGLRVGGFSVKSEIRISRECESAALEVLVERIKYAIVI